MTWHRWWAYNKPQEVCLDMHYTLLSYFILFVCTLNLTFLSTGTLWFIQVGSFLPQVFGDRWSECRSSAIKHASMSINTSIFKQTILLIYRKCLQDGSPLEQRAFNFHINPHTHPPCPNQLYTRYMDFVGMILLIYIYILYIFIYYIQYKCICITITLFGFRLESMLKIRVASQSLWRYHWLDVEVSLYIGLIHNNHLLSNSGWTVGDMLSYHLDIQKQTCFWIW